MSALTDPDDLCAKPEGRRPMSGREPCSGSSVVIPVPPHMTPSESWIEITSLGHLADPHPNPDWALMDCPGGDECLCRFIDRAPNYRRYHNDILVEGEAE